MNNVAIFVGVVAVGVYFYMSQNSFCPTPESSKHAHLVSCNEFERDQDPVRVCKFECDEGFVKVHSTDGLLHCLDGNTWRGTPIQCEEPPREAAQEIYRPREYPPEFNPSEYVCTNSTHWLNKIGDHCKYIGGGFCGKIYEIWDTDKTKRYALKLQDNRKKCLKPEEAYSYSIKSDFVVPALGIYPTEESTWILYPFIDGGTLDKKIKKRDPSLTFERRKKYMLQMLQAVHDIHTQGVTHQDINPTNMLIEEEGDILKLADFGLANFDDFLTYKEALKDWSFLYLNTVSVLFKGDQINDCFALTNIQEPDGDIFKRCWDCISMTDPELYPWPRQYTLERLKTMKEMNAALTPEQERLIEQDRKSLKPDMSELRDTPELTTT